jgi:hypothetical protein
MKHAAKAILAWPITWALFWTGHVVSSVFLRWDSLAFMYPTYNRLMCWSIDVQDWAGLKSPWSEVQP